MRAWPRQEPDVAEALAGLPEDARTRLEGFTGALERLHVDDLPLYAVRTRGVDHRRSVEAAAVLAIEAGLTQAIEAARAAVIEYVARTYGRAQFRATFAGPNTAPGLGPTDDRVQVMRSIGDAVTAIVLGDALDESDRAELIGAWDRLIP